MREVNFEKIAIGRNCEDDSKDHFLQSCYSNLMNQVLHIYVSTHMLKTGLKMTKIAFFCDSRPNIEIVMSFHACHLFPYRPISVKFYSLQVFFPSQTHSRTAKSTRFRFAKSTRLIRPIINLRSLLQIENSVQQCIVWNFENCFHVNGSYYRYLKFDC